MVSVCIATYNGEKFIKEQIQSILSQLSEEDEVIVSDDGSSDNTVAFLESFKDPRIVIYRNGFKNVVKNFEFAIRKAKGNIIFLSDQDDIWKEGKVSKILNKFDGHPEISLILTNADFKSDNADIDGKPFFKKNPPLTLAQNLIRNHFLGCTMAFRNINKDKIFPFPQNLAMHDWWIGLNHIKYGKPYFINESLVEYRRHENTVTNGQRASVKTGLKWRLDILENLLKR